jgi:hypothetical protein
MVAISRISVREKREPDLCVILNIDNGYLRLKHLQIVCQSFISAKCLTSPVPVPNLASFFALSAKIRNHLACLPSEVHRCKHCRDPQRIRVACQKTSLPVMECCRAPQKATLRLHFLAGLLTSLVDGKVDAPKSLRQPPPTSQFSGRVRLLGCAWRCERVSSVMSFNPRSAQDCAAKTASAPTD